MGFDQVTVVWSVQRRRFSKGGFPLPVLYLPHEKMRVDNEGDTDILPDEKGPKNTAS